MGTMRTKEMIKKYEAHKRALDPNVPCELCTKEPLQTFQYWKITDCMFPWDKIAETHHLILPLRHATDLELTAAEWQELHEIKQKHLQAAYEVIAEATNKKKSIPGHWHLHLIISKE